MEMLVFIFSKNKIMSISTYIEYKMLLNSDRMIIHNIRS
jgi:hypothetical protein